MTFSLCVLIYGNIHIFNVNCKSQIDLVSYILLRHNNHLRSDQRGRAALINFLYAKYRANKQAPGLRRRQVKRDVIHSIKNNSAYDWLILTNALISPMSEIFKAIFGLIERKEIVISNHGYDELAADFIFVQDIMAGIKEAIVVEN